MTDGNLHAIGQHEAEREAWEASLEPCDTCDDEHCTCAEDATHESADHKLQMMKED